MEEGVINLPLFASRDSNSAISLKKFIIKLLKKVIDGHEFGNNVLLIKGVSVKVSKNRMEVLYDNKD